MQLRPIKIQVKMPEKQATKSWQIALEHSSATYHPFPHLHKSYAMRINPKAIHPLIITAFPFLITKEISGLTNKKKRAILRPLIERNNPLSVGPSRRAN
jgi:hypothetical protein